MQWIFRPLPELLHLEMPWYLLRISSENTNLVCKYPLLGLLLELTPQLKSSTGGREQFPPPYLLFCWASSTFNCRYCISTVALAMYFFYHCTILYNSILCSILFTLVYILPVIFLVHVANAIVVLIVTLLLFSFYLLTNLSIHLVFVLVIIAEFLSIFYLLNIFSIFWWMKMTTLLAKGTVGFEPGSSDY